MLDTIDTKGIHKKKTPEGKNLLHIVAEYSSGGVAQELFDEVYNLIISLKIDTDAQDDEGRLPLHYALKNQNLDIATRLLKDRSQKDIIVLCNTEDNDGLTAFSMLYHKVSLNQQTNTSPLNMGFFALLGDSIKDLNPFVRFSKLSFPYTAFSYLLEDGIMIHPLILMIENANSSNSGYNSGFGGGLFGNNYGNNNVTTPNPLDVFRIEIINLDLEKPATENLSRKKNSKESNYNFIDWLFKLGKVTVLKNDYFKKPIGEYLKKKKNVEKIEEILGTPLKDDTFSNVPRILKFTEEFYGVKLKIPGFNSKSGDFDIAEEAIENHKSFRKGTKIMYDYNEDSEKYLDKIIPELEKEMEDAVAKKGKKLECVLDSNQPSEKH